MNLNLERVREVIEELEQHRQLIDDALKSLTSLEKVFDGGEAQSTRKTAAAIVSLRKSNGVGKVAHNGFACVKHPQSREFSARGRCKLCQSEYMKEYWSKKKKMRVAKSIAPKPAATAEAEDASDFVYSKQQRCPRCGLTTRFRRDRGASPNESWVCLGAGCELKTSNYRITVDRDYLPSDDDSILQIS
jgi:hypothetical protein